MSRWTSLPLIYLNAAWIRPDFSSKHCQLSIPLLVTLLLFIFASLTELQMPCSVVIPETIDSRDAVVNLLGVDKSSPEGVFGPATRV